MTWRALSIFLSLRVGVCIFARAVLDTLEQSHRKVVLFDAFGGFGSRVSHSSTSQLNVNIFVGYVGWFPLHVTLPMGDNSSYNGYQTAY
jgi:pantothenate kinase-related protein Tda10